MTENSEEVERLRRVAYGPGVGAAERAEAEAALRTLVSVARHDEGRVSAVPISDAEASASTEEVGYGHGGVGKEGLESLWARHIRVGWLVPIIAGALLVGVLAALTTTGWFERGESETAPTTGQTTLEPPDEADPGFLVQGGNLDAADAWFSGQATAADAYPFSAFLDLNDIDPYEVRFAHAAGGDWNLWVARTGDGKLCLLSAYARDGTGGADCVQRDAFAAGGVHLGIGDRVAHWFGGPILMTLSDDPDLIRLPSA